MQSKEVPLQEVSQEVARVELILKLPEINEAIGQLQRAQKVDRETMNIEFVV